ncbi:MAG: hypothetical protein K2J39_07620 [Ruminococcus sp.]|nr:hypothetical protein [Ruminococcus sp.]
MYIDNILENFNDTETARRFSGVDVRKNTIQAVLPYLIPLLFFLPIVADKNSLFCKFHANQQFTWFLLTGVLVIVKNIIGIIPLIGGIANAVLNITQLAVAVALAYGAYKGKALKLPYIADLVRIF